MSIDGAHVLKEFIDHDFVRNGRSVAVYWLDDLEAQAPWFLLKREPSVFAYEAGEMILMTCEGLEFHNDRDSCHNDLSCCAGSIRRHAS
jgi:hypothetical protein